MHGIGGTILNYHSYSVSGPSNSYDTTLRSGNIQDSETIQGLNDHSYSVSGVSNVELDHHYTTKLQSLSRAHDIQSTETIQGTEYFNFRVPGDGNCFFNSLSLALNRDFTKSRHY